MSQVCDKYHSRYQPWNQKEASVRIDVFKCWLYPHYCNFRTRYIEAWGELTINICITQGTFQKTYPESCCMHLARWSARAAYTVASLPCMTSWIRSSSRNNDRWKFELAWVNSHRPSSRSNLDISSETGKKRARHREYVSKGIVFGMTEKRRCVRWFSRYTAIFFRRKVL